MKKNKQGRKPAARPLKNKARKDEFWKWIRENYPDGSSLIHARDLAQPISEKLKEIGGAHPSFESLRSTLNEQLDGRRTIPPSTIRAVALLCGVDASDLKTALDTGDAFPEPRTSEGRSPSTGVSAHSNLIAEKSYFNYRARSSSLIHSPELISHLEDRYKCSAFELAGVRYPATILWKNTGRNDHGKNADSILGTLDSEEVTRVGHSPILSPEEYSAARLLLKNKLENERTPGEAMNYTMTRIEKIRGVPRIHGAIGRYYDNLLTQYAMEWELTKALVTDGLSAIPRFRTPGTLPLREAIEAQCNNPLWEGTGRCASITVSTFLVYRRDGQHRCLLRRRSNEVAVSQRMLHVVPAGMFDALDLDDKWSVVSNTWRELLEEVYDERQEQSSAPRHHDHMLTKKPIPWLKKRLGKSVELSVTGICCDLLNLRTEICTILYVQDEEFWSEREAKFNWEYEANAPKGRFAIQWDKLDETMLEESKRNEAPEVDRRGIVPGCAVCVGLGREWLKRNYGP